MSLPASAKVHVLKTDPLPFEAIFSGFKTGEIRKNDRDYEIGDEVHLRETGKTGQATGRTIIATVTHIQAGYGLLHGYVMLSLNVYRIYFSPSDFITIQDADTLSERHLQHARV
jgi:uncharacterized protein DUF3850